jgi:DnaK suppressor protein
VSNRPRDTDGWVEKMRVRLTEDFQAQQTHLQQLLADTSEPEEAHTHDALVAATRQSLEQVTAALKRIEVGAYGDCERCGTPIPRERLEALPHARYCVPCLERHAN